MKAFIITLLVPAVLAVAAPANAVTLFDANAFDAGDLSIDGGNGWKNYDNGGNYLSDSESYVMRAYTQMYRATGDTHYLNKLIDHADAVLANRDDFANLPHEVPGNNPMWSSAQYGLVSAPLTQGVILQGMTQFARLIHEEPALAANPVYAAKAATYVQRAQETVNWLNANYLWDPGTGRSVYSPYPNQNLRDAPHVDATIGSVLLDMYHAGGGASLLTGADRLARHIQFSAFFTTDQGNLAWVYDYDAPDPEDISHGAHAAPFLSHMAAGGRVITAAQAKGLAASLIEEAYLGGGNVTSGMEGSSPLEDRFGPLPATYWSWGMAGGMIDLAQFDLRLLPLAEAVQLQHFGTTPNGFGSALLGIANLVRYSRVPQEARLSLSVQMGPNVYATTGTSVATLIGPTVVTLVNQTNPNDVRQVTIELGGEGDEWNRRWDLSVLLDATGAPDLIGGTVQANISLRDGAGQSRHILAAARPAGYQLANVNYKQAQWIGTLGAAQSFVLRANESVTIYVHDDFDIFANGGAVQAGDPNWTLGGDSIPAGSSATATISTTTFVSGNSSLLLKTDSGETLLRPRWNRDLSNAAPASAAAPIIFATVSLDFNYNYSNSLSDTAGMPAKSYPQNVWIYVTNDLDQNVAAISVNGGYYDWKFGLEYENGASGSNVRNDDWHNLKMGFDFDAQTVTYFLDHVQEYMETLTVALLDGAAGLGALRIENGINGPSGIENNTIFVDNVVFSAVIVPEPGSLALLGSGLVAMGRRRQSQRS